MSGVMILDKRDKEEGGRSDGESLFEKLQGYGVNGNLVRMDLVLKTAKEEGEGGASRCVKLSWSLSLTSL